MRLILSILLPCILLTSFPLAASASPAADLQTAHASQEAEPARAGILLSAELAPGWSNRYQITSRLELKANDESIDLLEQIITLRLAAVAREDNEEAPPTVTVRATIERANVTLTSSGDTVQTIIPAPANDVDPPNDASPHLARIYRSLSEAVLEFEISPTGRARLISGLDTALSAAEAVEPQNPSRFLGVLAPGAVERTIAAIITLDPHNRSRTPSATWRDEQRIPMMGAPGQLVTDYTLVGIDNGRAQVRARITAALDPSAAPVPTQPAIAIEEQSGELTALWDVENRRLIERTSETRIVMSARLRTDPPIEASRTATSRVTISLQPEPDR